MSSVVTAHLRIGSELDRTKAVGLLGDDAVASKYGAIVMHVGITNSVAGYESGETQTLMLHLVEVSWEFSIDADEARATMRSAVEKELRDNGIDGKFDFA
jgi:hypothetical protein